MAIFSPYLWVGYFPVPPLETFSALGFSTRLFPGFSVLNGPHGSGLDSLFYMSAHSLEISLTPLAWNHIYAFGSQTSIASPDYLLALSICMSHRHIELKAPTNIGTPTSRHSTDTPRGQVRNIGLILSSYLPLPRTHSPVPSVLSSKYPLNLPTLSTCTANTQCNSIHLLLE